MKKKILFLQNKGNIYGGNENTTQTQLDNDTISQNVNITIGDILLINSSWVYQLQKNNVIAELYNTNTKTGIFTDFHLVRGTWYSCTGTSLLQVPSIRQEGV